MYTLHFVYSNVCSYTANGVIKTNELKEQACDINDKLYAFNSIHAQKERLDGKSFAYLNLTDHALVI